MHKNKNRPGYKKTKIGWIPEDWNEDKLSNSDIIVEDGDRGKHYPKQNEFTEKGYCIFLNAGNVTSNGFNFYETQFVSENRDTLLKKGKLQREDIVVTTRGTIGNFAYFNESIPYKNVRINSGMAIIRNNNRKLLTNYLLRYFNSHIFKKEIFRITYGSAVPQLTIKLINDFPVVVPGSLPEQEAIAEVLECWDDAIRNYEKKIEKKKNIKKGLMQRLLSGKQRLPGYGETYHEGHEGNEGGKKIPEGWREVRLGEVCEVIMGQSPQSIAYNTKKEGLPLLQGNNDFRNGSSNPNQWTRQITKKCYPGDLLMSVRAPVGTFAISQHEACIGRGVCAIEDKSINKKYLFQLLLKTKKRWMKLEQGSTFTAVNGKDIRKFKITIPFDKEEQKAIALVLSDADNGIHYLERKLVKLKNQKKYLLNNLVTGTIRLPSFKKNSP